VNFSCLLHLFLQPFLILLHIHKLCAALPDHPQKVRISSDWGHSTSAANATLAAGDSKHAKRAREFSTSTTLHLTRCQAPPIVLVSLWMPTCHGREYRLCLCRDSFARSRWVQGNALQERRHQDRQRRVTPGHPGNHPRAHELSLETLVSILFPNALAE
jgi:hypothetical protein